VSGVRCPVATGHRTRYDGRVPRLRKPQTDQIQVAIEELATVASGVRGLDIRHDDADQVTITVGKERWSATVVARDAISASVAEHLVASGGRGSKIIVANQISAEARDVLDRTNETDDSFGWSWLDRRGELQLNHPTAVGAVHFDRAASERRAATTGRRGLAAPASDGPIRGRAGISFAVALLLDPTRRPSIREVARDSGMSHGAVGDAVKLLREAGLILPDGAPASPDLFWALAAVWGPTRVTPVASLPTADQAERLGAQTEDLDEPGWGLGGDEAAASLGAPLLAVGGQPWIWVPTEVDARRVERVLTLVSWEACAAVIAVPPTVLACRDRQQPPGALEPPFLPTLHPLFLALVLAQDPARGHEILDQWSPDSKAVHRVW
jgi:hypothetical protein